MIEMHDTHCLAESVEHVMVAIVRETVAAIIAGGSNRDAAPAHFMDHPDAAPAWRAAGRSVLQIHIEGGQCDDGDLRFGDEIERAVALRYRLVGEAAAVATHNAPLIAVPQR